MKRLMIAAVAAVALAGCATSQDKYYEAITAQAKAQNDAQDRIEGQITALAATGDAQARGMAMAYWIMKGAKAGDSVVRIQPPQDKALAWASILVPAVTNLYGIQQSTRVNLANIEATTERYGLTMGTVSGIASQGIEAASKPPVIVSTQPTGSSVIFPVSE